MRRIGVPLALVLLFGLGACGGGGGDDGPDEAFCDGLETLSDQIADGDDIDDQIETIEEDLQDAASDDELEALENVADAYEDNDNDQADLAEEVQDELGDFAEECDIDEDEFAVAPTTTEPPTTEPPDTTDTTEPPDTTQPPENDGPLVVARAPVPGDIAPEFVDLANACFNGDMEACDTLFDTTPIDSPDEAYGETCGGRIGPEETQASQCSTIITGPIAVPAEIVDQAAAQACFGGDMVACDDLFRTSAADSLDEAYGALCAGRVQRTNALCVDIFGDVAFL